MYTSETRKLFTASRSAGPRSLYFDQLGTVANMWLVQPERSGNSSREDVHKQTCRLMASAVMSCRVISSDEARPLLGHQRTESHRTLVDNEDPRKTDGKEGPEKNLAWILAAVWSAMFLSALDGGFLVYRSQLGTAASRQQQERSSQRYSLLWAHTSIDRISRRTLAHRTCCLRVASHHCTGDYRTSLGVEEQCCWHWLCLGRGRYFVVLHHR
jgi:hypothetical protein